MDKCVLCCNALDVEEQLKYREKHGVCICDRCASIVSSAYESWHGGAGSVFGASASTSSNISGKKRWFVFKSDGYKCVKCGSDSDLTIDHVLPVSKGGSNNISNLQTLCRSCNSSKGDRV